MTKQKINTTGLFLKDTIKVIPTSEPMGIYYALRYLYSDDKDVNNWYNIKKNGGDYEQFYKEITGDFDPWHTTNSRNGVK